MFRTKCVLVVVVATAGAVVRGQPALAAVALTQDITGASEIVNSVTYTLGYEFVVGPQSLVVTKLGMWDGDATDGLIGPHEVGIWALDGSLLASVTVPAGTGSSKVGEYRYVDLGTPLLLDAGVNYRAGAATTANTDPVHGSVEGLGSGPVFSTPDVNYVSRAANISGGFNFPNDLFSGDFSAWDAPNFEYSAIPEPPSLTLLALAAFGLLFRRRGIRHPVME